MLHKDLISCEETDHLQKHKNDLLQLVNKLFGHDLATQEDFIEKLPLVKWKKLTKTPGAFPLYLLCSSDWNRKLVLFVEEMLSSCLVPNKQTQILKSRNLSFQLPYWKNPLFFIELVIHVSDSKSLKIIQQELPETVKGLKLGVRSPGHVQHILAMKRLAYTGNTSFIYESVTELIRRYPKRFSYDIFREIQHFLAHPRKEFSKIRHYKHLCRIICARYLFQKALEKDIKVFPYSRHLYLKCIHTNLHYPFGLKKVLGLVIVLNSLQDYESFESRHILKAIEQFVPDIRVLQDSIYSHKNEENHLFTIYLEIEKIKDEGFSLKDIRCLKKELPAELKNSIEYLSPSLFIPRNEEELIRNIINLSQELRYVKDLPQAMISFQEQQNDVLRFNVILLRVLNKNSRTLSHLSRLIPNKAQFTQERIANVGYLRKKYIKEANVFTLDIESKLFLRKNHSVDLVKARQYVVKTLEKMLGHFRDYNGGFLLKQNEQLEAIKKALGPQGLSYAFLLENLFYSLTPSIMQTYIPPEKGKVFCTLFLQTLNIELPKYDQCLYKFHQDSDLLALVVKASDTEIKEILASVIKKMDIDSLQLASTSIEVERIHYQCYLFLNPSKNQADFFLNLVDTTLSSWIEKRKNLQAIHLHLPRATQSLDPRLGVDRTSGVVIKMLYEGLFRISESKGIEPAVAKSLTLSENRTTYFFHLRESNWSNGTPLTAYDFEYAWKKILEPDFRFSYSFLFFPIKNAEAVKKGEKSMREVGIRVQDDHTLCVELEAPFPSFVALTAGWAYSPLCREMDQKHPGWAYQSGESYVCNGPFKLDKWMLNDDLKIIKNPRYWDASTVKLDRIQLSILEEEQMALDLFTCGELDWHGDPLTKIPFKKIPFLKKKNLLQTSHSCYGLFWFQLNIDRLPFQSVAMRRAFSTAINRKQLIEALHFEDDIPAYGFSASPDETHPNDKQFDIERARKYFQQGLQELGIEKKNLPTIVITHSEIEEQEVISHEIGRQWEEVLGVKVRFERMLWNNYFEALHNGDHMAGGLSWYPRYDHPVYFYDLFIFREHTIHISSWKNPSYNALVHEAKYTEDPEECLKILQKAERILLDEVPVIPLIYQKLHYLKNPRLKGYILSNTNQIDFRAAYLESTHKEHNE